MKPQSLMLDQTGFEPLNTTLGKVTAEVRVLFVDDNVLSCRIGHRLLSKQGAQVQCATSGEEALAIVETSAFDLIVVDCMMPEMSGFDLAKQLRKPESKAASTPVVAITASNAPAMVDRAHESGIEQLLCKPLCAQSVLEFVKAG